MAGLNSGQDLIEWTPRGECDGKVLSYWVRRGRSAKSIGAGGALRAEVWPAWRVGNGTEVFISQMLRFEGSALRRDVGGLTTVFAWHPMGGLLLVKGRPWLI